MEQNMFIRILNSEMELATGCTEPGAVALTAAEAGQALRKAGVDKAEEITVNASINIIKNAMSAGIPGTDYEGMDYAAAFLLYPRMVGRDHRRRRERILPGDQGFRNTGFRLNA